jgi:hypothetical protein
MKSKHILCLAFCLLLPCGAKSQIYLNDDFSGTSVNSAIWQTTAPYSDSSVTEGGGLLTLNNGGGVLSGSRLTGPIDLTASFQFSGSAHDSFRLWIRASSLTLNDYIALDGIRVSFRHQEDTGNLLNNVEIENSGVQTLAIGTYPISMNTFYTFRLTDDGTTTTLYINDLQNPFLTASHPNLTGGHVFMDNRQGAASGSSISAGSQTQVDYIQIIPEPCGTWLLSLGGLVLIAVRAKGK